MKQNFSLFASIIFSLLSLVTQFPVTSTYRDISLVDFPIYSIPIWSPDGSYIAFISTDASTTSVKVMDSDGTNIVTLAESDSDLLYTPIWSPDSSKVAFVWGKTKPSIGTQKLITEADIFEVNRDGTGLFNLSGSNPETAHRVNSRERWSPDGWFISFSSDSDTSDLWVVELDNLKYTNLTRESDAVAAFSTWSPDSSELAFISYDTSDVTVYSLANHTFQSFVVKQKPIYLSWSPVNDAILIKSFLADMFIVSSNGKEIVDLKIDGANPVWAPDGSQILFQALPNNNVDDSSTSLNWDVLKKSADGTKLTNLTEANKNTDNDPSWSPDGSRIVFVSGRNGKSGIWVMNADGSNPVNLTGS